MEVAILGGGNFGTAIANIVAKNGYPTHLWMRDEQQVADCVAHGENRRYLPGHPLDSHLTPTADFAEAVANSSVCFVSVPSTSFREVSEQLASYTEPRDILISATKGIEAPGFRLMSQILHEVTASKQIGVLSGPNLAEEIADAQYTGTVIASTDDGLCKTVQTLLSSETFRVYESSDVYGVELAGALKNIYAIICGMAAGLKVGQNTVGMLITRSLAEMSRFAVSLGANPLTFLGLAGVGDLLVTCTSPLSRNFQLGFRLGEGMTLAEALADLGKLAEGVNTLKVVYDRSQELNVYMPLVAGLYQVIYEKQGIGEVVSSLMANDQAVDVEFAAPSQWDAKFA
ncbi:MAG: NAD(P)H-dependent glycerol-3-phosphate dehydrogenase [Gammaproteobacteria bacterium]|nr:NAD(P)H-dependent glycerol-3-phosphate dehydrogenase [Gammaproteobacteria bacterium]